MDKFEISIWKDEFVSTADFETILANKGVADGIALLEKRNDVERVSKKDQLLPNNQYILYDDQETGKYHFWQMAYYVDCHIKYFLQNFEKTISETVGSAQYCRDLSAYIKKIGKDKSPWNVIERVFPHIDDENPYINLSNRYDYEFINTKGNACWTDAADDGEIWRIKNENKESKVLIIANEKMDMFKGKIYNIHFIRNVDGTRTLTFDVNKNYIDLFTNERKDNEYLDYLHLKTKLKLHYRNKWYTFLINNRTEKHDSKGIYYSFQADDLAKEELGKIGYSLNFTEDPETIELCGAGTAKELTQRILANSDWQYSEDLTTANFQEYEEKVVYSPLEGKYVNKRFPTVTYNKHYSPFFKEYTYKTGFKLKNYNECNFDNIKEFNDFTNYVNGDNVGFSKTEGWDIYCRNNSNTVTTGSTPNLIASNSEFVSLDDWDCVDDNYAYGITKVGDDYCLRLGAGGQASTSNFVKTLSKGQYLFKIETASEAAQYKIRLYDNYDKEFIPLSSNLDSGSYYIFNLSSSCGSTGKLVISSEEGIVIKAITLIKLEVQDSDGNSVVISNISYPKLVKKNITNTPQKFYDSELEGYGLTLLQPDTVIEASTNIIREYFIEPFESIQQAREVLGSEYSTIEASEEWIIKIPEDKFKTYFTKYIKEQYKDRTITELKNSETNTIESLDSKYIEESATSSKTIYMMYDQYDNITAFESISYTYGENTKYEWTDLTLEYTTEKTRVVTGSKSNDYTFLTNVAEKFQVYVGFEIVHNPETGQIVYKEGRPVKYVYYTDRLGKKLYNGILENVNLNSINRKIDSNELVTKMYVENIETDYNSDGYVSIQLSEKNPSKENYIYNFKHYLNTDQLGSDFYTILDNHNAALKAINESYLSKTEELTTLKEQISKEESYKKTLEEAKVAAENKRQEYLEKLCYIGSGTYKYNGSELKMADLFQNAVLDLNGTVVGTSDAEYYKFNRISILDNDNTTKSIDSDLNYSDRTLIGDYDWVRPTAISHIYKLGTDTNCTHKETYAALEKLRKSKSEEYLNNETTGFLYEENTGMTYYYYKDTKGNYEYRFTSAFFYVRTEGSNGLRNLNANVINNPNWSLISYKDYCFTPKLSVTGTIANSYIDSYDQLTLEIIENSDLLEDVEKQLDTDNDTYESLTTEINNLLTAKNNMINSFESKYVQFIKEGYWSQSGYSDNDEYYLDALCAGNESALPKVEYSIEMIDLSPIDGYEEFYLEQGDETFIIDREIFGVDSTGKPIPERVVITQIDIQLDENKNNKITLRNYTSRFQDLFSMITASVTAVNSNEYQWDKAAILNADGTIPSSLLTQINTNNSSLVNSSIGMMNSYTLDENGLIMISQVDSNYQVKINSVGIFFTNTANKNTQWTLGLNADGINATAITAGAINTDKVTITSEYSPTQIWNSLGMTMYSAAGIDGNVSIDSDNFVRMDKHGFYVVNGKQNNKFSLNSEGLPWFYGRNYDETLGDIEDYAKVSITRDGFRYNSNPDSDKKSKIIIGKLGDSTEGIKFTDNEDNIIFKVTNNTSNNTSSAQICSFEFNNERMLKSPVDKDKNITKFYDYAGDEFLSAYGFEDKEPYLEYKNGKYVLTIPEVTNKKSIYLGTHGLSMNGIKLDATSGEATFAQIKLTGGNIEGNVRINQALLGPFTVQGQLENSKYYDEFIYALYSQSQNRFINGVKETPINRRTGESKSMAASTCLLTRKNKFYLGEFFLNKTHLDQVGFDTSLKQSFGSKEKGGILLSMGDNFWVHSSGWGYFGGDIFFSGKLSVESLDAQKLTVNGQDITAESIITKVTNYIQSGGSFGIKGQDGKDGKDGADLVMQMFPEDLKLIYIDDDNKPTQKNNFNLSGMPCIKFGDTKSGKKTNVLDVYIVACDGYLFYVTKSDQNEKAYVYLLAYTGVSPIGPCIK